MFPSKSPVVYPVTYTFPKESVSKQNPSSSLDVPINLDHSLLMVESNLIRNISFFPEWASPSIEFSDDPVMAAKILVDYAKDNEKLVIIGGGLEDKPLSKSDVEALAKLPSLNDLRGKLVGLLQAPASKLTRLNLEPASQVLRLISQKSK